jgi:hypothetical protein
MVNTGGGGGGGNYLGGGVQSAGGAGGSGIVVLSYPSTYSQLASVGVGLTYSYSLVGGNHVYTFTAGTGSISWGAGSALTLTSSSGLYFTGLAGPTGLSVLTYDLRLDL